MWGTLTIPFVQQCVCTSHAVQFYSDGGLSPGVGGAYGVQLLVYTDTKREQTGYLHYFDPHARSSFEMELRGLDAAWSYQIDTT